MVHRKPAKEACIAVRENEFQTFESHKDKEISLLFKQFAKKTTKKPRLFHLKTAMSDGSAEKKHAYSLPDRNVYGYPTQTGRDSTSCGSIAFLGVLRTYFMAEVGEYRFFGNYSAMQ